MKIESLKDLQKLIQLCRKMGVEAFEVGEIKMSLGPEPAKYKATAIYKQTLQKTLAPGGITEDVTIPTDLLTDEQLLFWSAQGSDASTDNQ